MYRFAAYVRATYTHRDTHSDTRPRRSCHRSAMSAAFTSADLIEADAALQDLCRLKQQSSRSRETTQQQATDRVRDTVLTQAAWDKWLWGSDPTEEIHPTAPLNFVHLLGLALARARALTCDMPPVLVHELLLDKRVHICETCVCNMKLSELADNIRNMQLLWPSLVETEDIEYLFRAIDSCFHRFGVLANCAWPPCVLDRPELVDSVNLKQPQESSETELPVGEHCCQLHNCAAAFPTASSTVSESAVPPPACVQLSTACIRRAMAFFLVAFRHLHLRDVSHTLDPDEPPTTEMHTHLLSASLDTFFSMSMYFDTPMSSCMEYRHEFTGMFNSITQVMYYNNPDYQRRPQKNFEDIVNGAQPIHILPLFLQIYPTVHVVHEEDALPAGFSTPKHTEHPVKLDQNQAAWAWFIVPGRIYLMHQSGAVHFSANAHPLFNRIAKTGENRANSVAKPR